MSRSVCTPKDVSKGATKDWRMRRSSTERSFTR
jgi:hypothetical protein